MWVILPPTTTAKRTPERPIQIRITLKPETTWIKTIIAKYWIYSWSFFKWRRFLNIKIYQNITDNYFKDKHTSHYFKYCSQAPWKHKTTWIKVLHHHTCTSSSNKQSLNKLMKQITTFLSWNGYIKWARNFVIKRLEKNRSVPKANRSLW